MYEAHWQLDARPFENSADASFYYPGESHQGTLLKLRYIVEKRGGGALLAGASGLGKTLLIRSLLERLPEHFSPRVHVVFPQMPPDQLLAYLAGELTGERALEQTPSIERSVRGMEEQLRKNAEEGRHAVVAVDEAHLLVGSGVLETLRLLLNLRSGGQAGLTLLLAGQTSLLTALERMPQLEERLDVKCLLRPFSEDETASYVSHRLGSAGGRGDLFTADALVTIHQLTGGVPRRINRLCDLALLIGFAEERTEIGAEQIVAVSDELVTIAPE